MLFVNLPIAQSWLGGLASRLLSDKLATDVRIERVKIGLFNRLTLHQVCVADTMGDTLLRADVISAKIEYSPLLEGRISLRTASLLDGYIRLYQRTPQEAPNYQFVADALSSKEKDKPSSTDFSLGSLIIRRLSLSYDKRYLPQTPRRFNPSHVSVKDLDANISLKRLTADSINLRVRSLAFSEQSGFAVRKIAFRMAYGSGHLRLGGFHLELPNSIVSEDVFEAHWHTDTHRPWFETLECEGQLKDARIALQDLSPFVTLPPGLLTKEQRAEEEDSPYFSGVITLNSRFAMRNSRLSAQDLSIADEGRAWKMKANFWADIKEKTIAEARLWDAGIDINLPTLSPLLNEKMGRTLSNAGRLSLDLDGRYQRGGRYHLGAKMVSAIGRARLAVDGLKDMATLTVLADSIMPNLLLDNPSLPGGMALRASARIRHNGHAILSGEADVNLPHLTYQGREHKEITAHATWDKTHFDANVNSLDARAILEAHASGQFKASRLDRLSFNANVEHLDGTLFTHSTSDNQPIWSGRIYGKLANLSSKDLSADIQVNHLCKQTADSTYLLKHLSFTANPTPWGTRAVLYGDFGHLTAEGPANGPLLKEHVQRIAGIFSSNKSLPAADHEPTWQFSAYLTDDNVFRHLLSVPLSFDAPLTFEGRVNSHSRSLLSFSAPRLAYNGVELRRPRLYATAEGHRLHVLLQGEKQVGKSGMLFVIESDNNADTLHTALTWQEPQGKYHGQVKAKTFPSTTEDGRDIVTIVQPTTFTMADTLWDVKESRIAWTKRGVDVQNFRLSHANQSLSVHGLFGKTAADTIHASLQGIEVSYILSLINLKPVSFAGRATGPVSITPSEGGMAIAGDLNIPAFRFNESAMGDAQIGMRINTADMRLHFDAAMIDRDTCGTAVQGYVGIKEKLLNLRITSKETDVRFLRRYVGHLFDDIEGRTSGFCHLHGTFKNLIFEGNETIDAKATIPATGIRYRLYGGALQMTPSCFRFTNVNISDMASGTGLVNGDLTHDHLRNFRYDIGITAHSMRLYDKGASPLLPFFATAVGTGQARIYGAPGTFTADLQMQTMRGTSFTYTVDSPETDYDFSLLTFGSKSIPDGGQTTNNGLESSVSMSKDKTTAQAATPSNVAQDAKEEQETDMRLNLVIGATPDATLKVITDEKTGNYIRLHGNGSLRAAWYNKGAFQMFGTYHVTDGLYKLILQDVIHKDFRLKQGGTIIFGGNPYDGDLNLNAVYTVPSVSLADLGLDMGDRTIRADCILHLGGKVRSPLVSFDLGLTGAGPEVQNMVSRLLSSEEDKNMQVLYLLGVGRFYNYNYAASESAANGQTQSSVAMKSFLSSTLSGQINHFISNAIGASNWTFGANVSTGQTGWDDMEVGGLLSGRLMDGRLLVNGNFGYRDRPTSNTGFVGDFDITYALTPSGWLSVKAYSENNERYFSHGALTTQGVGLIMRRDFFSLGDLFHPQRKRKASGQSNTP